MHRRLERNQEGIRYLADVVAGDDRPDAALGDGLTSIDAYDVGLVMG